MHKLPTFFSPRPLREDLIDVPRTSHQEEEERPSVVVMVKSCAGWVREAFYTRKKAPYTRKNAPKCTPKPHEMHEYRSTGSRDIECKLWPKLWPKLPLPGVPGTYLRNDDLEVQVLTQASRARRRAFCASARKFIESATSRHLTAVPFRDK